MSGTWGGYPPWLGTQSRPYQYPQGRQYRHVGSFPEPGRLAGGLLKPLWIGWVFSSGEPKYSVRNSLGVRFGRTEVQCADNLGCSVWENRSTVRGKTVIPRTNSLNVLLLDYLCILGLSATLRRCSPLYECDSILRIYLYVWLKCYLSGDALHGSGSRINPIKRYLCCVTSLSRNP